MHKTQAAASELAEAERAAALAVRQLRQDIVGERAAHEAAVSGRHFYSGCGELVSYPLLCCAICLGRQGDMAWSGGRLPCVTAADAVAQNASAWAGTRRTQMQERHAAVAALKRRLRDDGLRLALEARRREKELAASNEAARRAQRAEADAAAARLAALRRRAAVERAAAAAAAEHAAAAAAARQAEAVAWAARRVDDARQKERQLEVRSGCRGRGALLQVLCDCDVCIRVGLFPASRSPPPPHPSPPLSQNRRCARSTSATCCA